MEIDKTKKTKEERTTLSESSFLSSDNPLQEVEKDLKMLVKKCNSLCRELIEIKVEHENQIKGLLLEFIEFIDAFEEVMDNIQPSLNLNFDSFMALLKLAQRALSNCGVSPLKIEENEKVNPAFHFVADVVSTFDREEGTIIRVIKKGYLWEKKLIRPAHVIAVKNE